MAMHIHTIVMHQQQLQRHHRLQHAQGVPSMAMRMHMRRRGRRPLLPGSRAILICLILVGFCIPGIWSKIGIGQRQCPPSTSCSVVVPINTRSLQLNPSVSHITSLFPPCGYGQHPQLGYDLIPPNCTQCVCNRSQKVSKRMIFATVPRSGNTWMRKMLEYASKVPTQTIYHNEKIKPPTNKTTPHDENGMVQLQNSSLLYRSRCGLINNCNVISRGEAEVPMIIAKTHAPFILLTDKQGLYLHQYSDVGIGAAALISIRNPLDNFDAWRRYKLMKGGANAEFPGSSFSSFMQLWTNHFNHWGNSAVNHNVSTIFYRFEDLSSTECRKQIIRAALKLSGLYDSLHLTDVDILDAAHKYSASGSFQDRIGSAHGKSDTMRYPVEDIELALKSPWVHRFGYNKLLETWLSSDKGKWNLLLEPHSNRCYHKWPV